MTRKGLIRHKIKQPTNQYDLEIFYIYLWFYWWPVYIVWFYNVNKLIFNISDFISNPCWQMNIGLDPNLLYLRPVTNQQPPKPINYKVVSTK